MAFNGANTHRLLLLRYRPRQWIWRVLLSVLLLAALLGGSYFLGIHHAMNTAGDVQDSRDVLLGKLTAAEALQQQYQAQVDALTLTVKVDHQAAEEQRQRLSEQEKLLDELRKANNFYRRLIPGGDKTNGLSFGSFELRQGENARHFVYRVVVQQTGDEQKELQGKFRLSITGQQSGRATTLELQQLSPAQNEDKIQLRFRYFQLLEGEVNLPDSFVPQKISLVVTRNNIATPVLEQAFNWEVRE